MGKNKLLTITLAVIIVALCLAIYYTQRRLNIMRIAFNRSDRELAILKEDYNVLYNAYYLYNQKIKNLLATTNNTHWSTDSSTYLVGNAPDYLFGFVNKPTMKSDHYLWQSGSPDENESYIKMNRVDSLKPHQFLSVRVKEGFTQLLVAPADQKNNLLPDTIQKVATIRLK